jgi:hypothetical protein
MTLHTFAKLFPFRGGRISNENAVFELFCNKLTILMLSKNGLI